MSTYEYAITLCNDFNMFTKNYNTMTLIVYSKYVKMFLIANCDIIDYDMLKLIYDDKKTMIALCSLNVQNKHNQTYYTYNHLIASMCTYANDIYKM